MEEIKTNNVTNNPSKTDNVKRYEDKKTINWLITI